MQQQAAQLLVADSSAGHWLVSDVRPDRFISHLRICSGSQSISETVPVRLGTTSSRSPRSNEPNASSCRPISSRRTSQNAFAAVRTSSRLILPVSGILVTLAPVTQLAHIAPIQVLSAPPAAKVAHRCQLASSCHVLYLRHPCYVRARLAYAILTAWLGSCTKLANKAFDVTFPEVRGRTGP